MVDERLDKIISYAVGADGILGEARDEITTGLSVPIALAFSGGRAYVGDSDLDKIISYAVGADGILGAARDEITTGLSEPLGIAFSGGWVYVVDSILDKIISYPLFQILPPVAPDAPRVVAQSESEIEIAWNAVSGATHYKLYQATTSGGLYTWIGGDISVTRYHDGDLSANASYYYQLEACNSGGCSGRSPVGSATTAPAMPATPTAAAQSDTEISIVWSEVAGVTHYKLVSGDGERRDIYANWRRHCRNRLSRQRPFRDNRLLLSTGGLQQRRVFGAFARSFGHNLRDRLFGRGARRDNDWFGLSARPRVFRRSGVCGGQSRSISQQNYLLSGGGRMENWARGATR